MSAPLATYVYCVLRAAKPGVKGAPAGIPNASRPRLLDAGGGLFLVVADAPLSQYGEAPIEKGLQDLPWVSKVALAHEAVVEHFAKSRSILPLKLFTLFTSDARAVADLGARRKAVGRALDRVEGCLEYGLKVSFDEARAAKDAEARANKRASPGNPGAHFLMRKKELRDVSVELQERARERAEEVYGALSALCQDSSRRPLTAPEQGTRLLLEGALLVPEKKEKRFLAAVKKRSAALAKQGYGLTLTGPWPPYHFISDAA